MTPSLMTTADLASYQAKRRDPVSTDYRGYRIVAMPGPSSGGITVASTMGILSNFDLPAMGPTDVNRDGGRPNPAAVHLVDEAERLAYADRDKYIADPDFIPLPGRGVATMLDPAYLKQRAALIRPNTSLGEAQPGNLGDVPLGSYPGTEHGTSHITVADRYGNVATMTTTVESAFGSFHMVDGFILNNQLTDFSAEPRDASGALLANRVSQAAALVDGADDRDATRHQRRPGHSRRRTRFARRIGDHPVRRENTCRHARLEPQPTAGSVDDRLRLGQHTGVERRW